MIRLNDSSYSYWVNGNSIMPWASIVRYTNVTFGKSNNVPSFSCGVDVSVHNGDNLSGVIVVKFDHTFGIAHTEKVITLFVVY